MPKLVAGWILGIYDFWIVRVQISLLVIKIIFIIIFYLTSLAELVQWLPSKQQFIGSNPIRCYINKYKKQIK